MTKKLLSYDKQKLLIESWRKYIKSGHVDEGFIDSVKSAMGSKPRDTTPAKRLGLDDPEQLGRTAQFMVRTLETRPDAFKELVAKGEKGINIVKDLADVIDQDLGLNEKKKREPKGLIKTVKYLKSFETDAAIFDELRLLLVDYMRTTEYQLGPHARERLRLGPGPTNESLYNFWHKLI